MLNRKTNECVCSLITSRHYGVCSLEDYRHCAASTLVRDIKHMRHTSWKTPIICHDSIPVKNIKAELLEEICRHVKSRFSILFMGILRNGFAKVALCNSNHWRYTLDWMPLDRFPLSDYVIQWRKTTVEIEIASTNVTWGEDLYVFL